MNLCIVFNKIRQVPIKFTCNLPSQSQNGYKEPLVILKGSKLKQNLEQELNHLFDTQK